MVIQHNISSIMTNRQLGISNNNTGKRMERLSSGYKINRAADDAAALSISEKLRSQIRGLDQASTNMDDAVSLIQVADGAMSEIDSLLQRVNELCVQGANDTNQDIDRTAIQTEITQLLEEVNSITENTEFNGIKILKAGTSSQGPIFGVNGSLSSVLKNMANGGNATSTPIGSLSEKLYSDIPNYTNTITSIKTGIPPTAVSLPITINGRTYNTIGQIYSLSSNPMFGATPNSPSAGVVVVKDTATNVDYTFSLLSTYDPYKNTHSAAFIDFSNVTAANVNTLIGTGFHTTCCSCNERYSIRFVNTPSAVKQEGTNYIYEVDISGLSNGEDIIKKIMQDLKNRGTTESYIQSNSGATVQVTNPQNHYTWFGAELDATTGRPTGRLLIADKRNGINPDLNLEMGIFGEGVYGFLINGSTTTPDLLNIQSGANTGQSVQVFLPNTKLDKLGLNGTIKVASYELATSSIAKVQAAVATVNAQRSYLGAMQNRFEHGITNADNSSENLQTSESLIRDASIPEEMMQYAKSSILREMSQSMLAQAVKNPEKILALLQ